MNSSFGVRGIAVVAVALAVLLVACGGSTGGSRSTVLVFSASSLTDAFGAVESALEVQRPDLDIVLNLAGSSTLREQILGGAPADVFASANMSNMDMVVDGSGVQAPPVVFADNSLQIVVPPGNPGGVEGLEDFARDELLIGLCAEAVPCGEFARQALAEAGVTPAIDTNEPDVRALLTKVAAGELDAGITYVTDVVSAGDRVEGILIPEDENVVVGYPIAVLDQAANTEGAETFLDFVTGEEGQAILAEHGFTSP